MPNEHHYALVVGIADYPELHADLNGAHDDAMAIRDWLVGMGQVPEGNIQLVLSERRHGDDAVPGQREIDRGFTRLFDLAKERGDSRRLYVYFAGHGGSTGTQRLAVLLSDASLNTLNSSLNTDEYHAQLRLQALFPEQILFYDCCRNFNRGMRGRGPNWTDTLAGDQALPDPALATLTQCVGYAAGFTQYANSNETVYNVRRGLFTAALLEGLRGKAINATGQITFLSLQEYVKKRLPELVDPGLQQNSDWPNNGDLLIADLPPPAKSVQVTLHFNQPGTDVAVRDVTFAPLQRMVLENSACRFAIAPGKYIVSLLSSPADLVGSVHYTLDIPDTPTFEATL